MWMLIGGGVLALFVSVLVYGGRAIDRAIYRDHRVNRLWRHR